MKGCLHGQFSHNNGISWTLSWSNVGPEALKIWNKHIQWQSEKFPHVFEEQEHCVYEAIEMWKSEEGPRPLLRSCQWPDGLALLARIVGRWDFVTQVVIYFWFLQFFESIFNIGIVFKVVISFIFLSVFWRPPIPKKKQQISIVCSK